MTNAPDVVYEGGYLPVNAELIEQRLNEIWNQGSAESDQKPLVKLCLSNMLIVADAASRLDAENLAQQIALRHPSRVMMIVIDPILTTYSAFVRTACEFNTELDAYLCWEIIEIVSDEPRAERIAGAVRSLLVDAVPVLTIDFRAYQTTPEFDADLRRMSDYYIVQADVVAAGSRSNRLIPLSWYRTLSVREILGQAYGLVLGQSPDAKLDRITLYYDPASARLDPLLAGWLIHRLADNSHFVTDGDTVRFHHAGKQIALQWRTTDVACAVFDLHFERGGALSLSADRTRHQGMCTARAAFGETEIVRQTEPTSLLAYLLAAANGGGREFDEYAAVQRVMTMLPIP